MARGIRISNVLDTRQHFLEASPQRKRLQKQFQQEGGRGLILSGLRSFRGNFSSQLTSPKSWAKALEATLVMISQNKEIA